MVGWFDGCCLVRMQSHRFHIRDLNTNLETCVLLVLAWMDASSLQDGEYVYEMAWKTDENEIPMCILN